MSVHFTMTGRHVIAARKKYKIEYPDMGCGRYAAKLSDKDWVSFNNAQRAHLNYLEQLPTMMTLTLLSGLFMPRASAALAGSMLLGRELFARGYIAKGAPGRMRGAPFYYPGLLGSLGVTIYGGLNLLGYL
jgi:glutathione S-transferase